MILKRGLWIALLVGGGSLLAAACTLGGSDESLGRQTEATNREASLEDDAGTEKEAREDSGDESTQCQPTERQTVLGFGATPLSFADCDRAVRTVASLPIDQGFLDAVTSGGGLAKCINTQHCSAPDPSSGAVGSDPTGLTCDQVIKTYLPQYLRGSMLPAIEIVQRIGCPGSVPTCVVSHGGLQGGDFAFGPAPLDGVSCPGDGGTATSLTTLEVLEAYGYADDAGNTVTGLPASVTNMARTIGETFCQFGTTTPDAGEGMIAGDGGDGGGGAGGTCGQYAQYSAAYGSGLSMGAGRLAGNAHDALMISNIVAGALHASAAVDVDGVDCSQLGLTKDYNLLGIPVLTTTGDDGGSVVTAALPSLFELAFATRIGLPDTSFPDLSPNAVPMSTFNGTASAMPLLPYQSASQVPATCAVLSGDTRAPLVAPEEYSGTLGSPNWVQVISVGTFTITVGNVPVQMVLALTDPCCNPT
jgi:hypothetical protein